MKRIAVRLILLGVSLIILGYYPPIAQVNLHEAWVNGCEDGDTIQVKFSEKPDKLEGIRYLLASAPEASDCLGPDATDYNCGLVSGKQVWLEIQPKDGDYLRGSNHRILAYVYLDSEGADMVNLRLVQTGYAKIDVRDVRDDTPSDDFRVKHLNQFIPAQLEAAKAGKNWWGSCDAYKDSHLVIVFIKFWGGDEIVYILNRGEDDLDLISGWKLGDDDGNEITFTQAFTMGEPCLLPSGAVLRVHSGPAVPEEKRKSFESCGESIVDFYWMRKKVWGNKGDDAFLRNSQDELIYHYCYPPFSSRCRRPS